MTRDLTPKDAAELCFCVIPGDSRLVVLSPDKHWLAVCKDHFVRVYSMAAVVCDGVANPVTEWELPKFTKLKEVI